MSQSVPFLPKMTPGVGLYPNMTPGPCTRRKMTLGRYVGMHCPHYEFGVVSCLKLIIQRESESGCRCVRARVLETPYGDDRRFGPTGETRSFATYTVHRTTSDHGKPIRERPTNLLVNHRGLHCGLGQLKLTQRQRKRLEAFSGSTAEFIQLGVLCDAFRGRPQRAGQKSNTRWY